MFIQRLKLQPASKRKRICKIPGKEESESEYNTIGWNTRNSSPTECKLFWFDDQKFAQCDSADSTAPAEAQVRSSLPGFLQ